MKTGDLIVVSSLFFKFINDEPGVILGSFEPIGGDDHGDHFWNVFVDGHVIQLFESEIKPMVKQ